MKKTGNLKKVFFVSFTLCALAYLVLIANECTNVWDGLWSGSVDTGASWPLKIGRWFWPFITWSRLTVSPEPFTSLLTIALYVLSGCLILSVFSLQDTKAAYWVTLPLGINAVVCMSLSYRYMSPTFGMSVLLNVLGIWLLKTKKNWWTWALATGCFILALGTYQAYIGCAAVLFMACIMQMLIKQEEKKSIVSFALRTAASLLLACVMYKVLWDLALWVTHIEPAGYRGADRVSIGNILTHLPLRVKDAYVDFYSYVMGKTFRHHAFQDTPLYPAAALAFALVSLAPVARLFRSSKSAAILTLVCFLCLPLAANVSLLMAPDAGGADILMSYPTVMLGPVLLCLFFQVELRRPVLRWVPILLIAFVLYGGFLQSSIDQHTMLHGRETTISFMDRVVADLESRDMAHSENKIIFLGRPAGNPLFRKDELWELANGRARYGNFPTEDDTGVMSYKGVARDGGYKLPLEEDHTVWHTMENKEEVREMPAYPTEGYCRLIDGHVVVKLSK